MTRKLALSTAGFAARVRGIFAPKDFLVHDGRALRRVRMGAGRQAAVAAAAVMTLGFSGYGASQAVAHMTPSDVGRQAASMEARVARLTGEVATIRETAKLHAQRIDQRQALLAAALTGTGEAKEMALATLAIDPEATRLSAKAIAPLRTVEARQADHAGLVLDVLRQRYADTTRGIRKLGLDPRRIAPRGAMGGPLIEATSAEAVADLKADQQFRSLFTAWKKLDTLEQGVIAIPSVQPVQKLLFTSNFGIRSDPFRGTAAMHAGVDIPGPLGTPIYATADGIVAHAERQGGYGNMVELNHGKGIATRYGHLSRIVVAPNTRVTRGQLIGMMGSTGRSTGSHLHYEVRIDGRAVNPVPFLTSADHLLAARDRSVGVVPVAQAASLD